MTLTVGSCFSGIGGLELGLERTGGFVTRWQIEIDDYATRVLEKHYPDVKRYRDITKLTGEELERVNLVCGGVPCQPWSVAGKQRGNDDERDLWPHFWRLCLAVRPRYVLVEEVPGFAVPGGLGRALTDFARAGFDAEWFYLSAADVGAPHLRRRLFLVAYPGGSRDGLQPISELRRGDTAGPRHDGAAQPLADAESEGLEIWRQAGVAPGPSQDFGPSLARPERRSRARWLPEPDVGRVANGVPSRVDRLRCLGNAVVPQVSEAIGRMILASIKANP